MASVGGLIQALNCILTHISHLKVSKWTRFCRLIIQLTLIRNKHFSLGQYFSGVYSIISGVWTSCYRLGVSLVLTHWVVFVMRLQGRHGDCL